MNTHSEHEHEQPLSALAKAALKQQEYRKNYQVLRVGIGPHREDKYKLLQEHALKRDAEESQLVWAALEYAFAHPDEVWKDVKQGAALRGGGAAIGFGIMPVYQNDRLVNYAIQEGRHRDLQKDAIVFLRFSPDDEKSRTRTYKQALGIQRNTLKSLGIDPDAPSSGVAL